MYSLANHILSLTTDDITQTFAWKRCIEADMPQCSPAKCQVSSQVICTPPVCFVSGAHIKQTGWRANVQHPWLQGVDPADRSANCGKASLGCGQPQTSCPGTPYGLLRCAHAFARRMPAVCLWWGTGPVPECCGRKTPHKHGDMKMNILPMSMREC